MKRLFTQNRFSKGLKKVTKRGRDHNKLTPILEALLNDKPLPHNARPHKLQGEWMGLWECHIESDWLLIYEIDKESVTLHATGSHQDLFKKY